MKTKPKKIIYIVNASIPNERAHGIQIGQTVEALSKVIPELSLVTPHYIGSPKASSSLNYKHIRLASLDIPLFDTSRFYIRIISFVISLQAYLLYALIASVLRRRRLVLYVRGEVIFGVIPFLLLCDVYFETHQIPNRHRWYAWVLRRVTGIVVVTERLKNKFLSDLGIEESRISVARDAVNFQKFASPNLESLTSDELEIKFPKNKKIVLYTGSFGHEKGVDTLAHAASHLPENIQIVFLGGLDWEISAFRAKYEHLKNVTILGQVKHDLVPAYVKRADVLILPDIASHEYSSLYTSPMKLFEYMASGKAIVASDVPSLREVLTEKTAFFFKPEDPVDLSKTILQALHNTEDGYKRGELAQKEVAKYTWDKRAENIMTLIHTFS